MKKILYILLLTMAQPLAGFAQTTTPYYGSVEVNIPNYTMVGDKVTFNAEVDFTKLKLQTNQMVELTPILRSTKSSYEVRFAPIVVSGAQRARVIARSEIFGDYTWAVEPSAVVVLKRKIDRNHVITITVPFEKWMRNSELVLVETCTACCNLLQEYGAGVTSKIYASKTPYVFPTPFSPSFDVSYMIPEVDPIKTNSDTYSAQLGFQVNSSNLLPQYGNNAVVLASVEKIVNEVKSDPLFTLKEVAVKGYASPEGNAAHNYTLSRDRAQAFVNYLTNRYGFRTLGLNIKAEGMGEDWAGLRKALAGSSLYESQSVIDAIDYNTDINKRKSAIKALSHGQVYRILLEEYYPSLRRNEYTVFYEIRGFNAEEAAKYVWTRPNLLSLNEFFMVSKLYAPSSKEYKEIFDIAARIFPNSEIAQFNTGAMEVESGSYDKAIERLSKIESAESWNNLGIAYWHKGEYDKSQESFNKAVEKGLETAVKNLEQFNRWFTDKE